MKETAKHARLWRRWWDLVDAFDGHVSVSKIPGHATLKMVAEGKITAMDRLGNMAADAAANKGARMHPDTSRTQAGLDSIADLQEAVVCTAARIAVLLHPDGAIVGRSAAARPKARIQQPKPPVVIPASVPALDVEGHETHIPVEVAYDNGNVLVICSRCGAYAGANRVVGLRGPCTSTRGTKQQIALVRRAAHPSRLQGGTATSYVRLPLGFMKFQRTWVDNAAPKGERIGRLYWAAGTQGEATTAVAAAWKATVGASHRQDDGTVEILPVANAAQRDDPVVVVDPNARGGHGIDFTLWTRIVTARPTEEAAWPTFRSFFTES